MERDSIVLTHFLLTQCILVHTVGFSGNAEDGNQTTTADGQGFNITADWPPIPANASDWCKVFRMTDYLIYHILYNNLTKFKNELFDGIRGHHKVITGIYFRIFKRCETFTNGYFYATLQAGGLRFMRIPVEHVTNFFSFNNTMQEEITKKFSKSTLMWQDLLRRSKLTTTFTVPQFL